MAAAGVLPPQLAVSLTAAGSAAMAGSMAAVAAVLARRLWWR